MNKSICQLQLRRPIAHHEPSLKKVSNMTFQKCRYGLESVRKQDAQAFSRLSQRKHSRIFQSVQVRATLETPSADTSITEPPTAVAPGPFRVVITGANKGLGLALAEQFVSAGDSVCITSRDQGRVDETVQALQARKAEGAEVCGVVCDVREAASVQSLSLAAQQGLGGVDLWINNAGSNGYSYAPLAETDPEVIREIVETNMLGTLLCTREAVLLMREQEGGGHVFNMEGAGSQGEVTVKYAAYGMSKAGMGQMAKSLSKECEGEGVGVHTLSPGLVWTELVEAGSSTFGKQGRFFINAIAEPPNAVAEVLVPMIREFAEQNEGGTGKPEALKFLTPDKALKKLYNRIIKGENQDRFTPEVDPNEDEEELDFLSKVQKAATIVVKLSKNALDKISGTK